MSLPVPETFVRRRPSTYTSQHSFEYEAGTLGSRSDLSNRDVRRNVHQENSPLGILSDLERFSPPSPAPEVTADQHEAAASWVDPRPATRDAGRNLRLVNHRRRATPAPASGDPDEAGLSRRRGWN